MVDKRIRIEEPISVEIGVDENDDSLCGCDCVHWYTMPQHAHSDVNKAMCVLFGRLAWVDSDMTRRHKKCLECRVLRIRRQ